ncbi:hypothetical protein PDG61_16925 [Mycolicibacterium sp. BiH015]|uniref:hypothetical protein n=1 Tax=Mycolicibacterium sp. BiH015 TaxID=3018808 RepID=UPI0022E89AEE|nr:hypothetical protein [Mycolicibacterium sp. BiH015]MDA2892606.1 hypothetical protein [Mycolicibacterium sp. BiH015]
MPTSHHRATHSEVGKARASARRARRGVLVSATLVSFGSLAAAPSANADPLGDIRALVENARNGSICNPIQYSGVLEGYAQQWVRTARALATLDTPTFPADAYDGDALGNIASADPTRTANNQLMSIATEDIHKCGYYEYGVGMVRDDVTELSYVAIIVGKPNVPKPNPGPPVNNLPPAPATAPAPAPVPAPPATPTATVTSDVDVYDIPGGVGTVTGILRGGAAVDLQECRADNWCRVTGALVPGGGGWVWGDFLRR